MPEATKCEWEELLNLDAGPGDIDGEVALIEETQHCTAVAAHAMVTRVEGVAEPHTDHLCCYHRAQVLEEIVHGCALGVAIESDLIIKPLVTAKVVRAFGGNWVAVLSIVATESGAAHSLRPVNLQATDYETAVIEAAGHVTRLQSIAEGNEPGELE